MITFLLTAALFMTAVNTYAEPHVVINGHPPYPTVTILEQRITLDISNTDYRGLLRFASDEDILPEAVIADLICYSDGSGEIALLDDFKEIWSLFTASGQFVLNNDMVTMGSEICDKKLEELYGYHIGESSYTWHF